MNHSYKKGTEDLEAFHNMDICLKYADLEIIESDHYGIEYCIEDTYKLQYSVSEDALTIYQNAKSNGSFYFFNWGSDNDIQREYVRLYVVADTSFDNVSIDADASNITMGDMTADTMTVNNKYGNLLCKEAVVSSSDIELDSGNCEFDKLTVDDFAIQAKYGKVTLHLTEKLGSYGYDLDAEYGSIQIGGKDMGEKYSVLQDTDSMPQITVHCDSGDIEIDSCL